MDAKNKPDTTASGNFPAHRANQPPLAHGVRQDVRKIAPVIVQYGLAWLARVLHRHSTRTGGRATATSQSRIGRRGWHDLKTRGGGIQQDKQDKGGQVPSYGVIPAADDCLAYLQTSPKGVS